MHALITGGGGFIGSHLARELVRGGHRVRVLDNFRTGKRRNLEGVDVELVEGSVTDRAAVERAMQGVEYVFHLAAFVSVPESVERPHECVDINVHGLLHVLEAAAAAGVRKLCFSSSAAVYGETDAPRLDESMAPAPKSPYAVTKLDGEYYCRQFAESGRLATVALRYFNVFGSRQDPGSAYAAAVPIFFRQALAGKPLTIFGDGGQTRDFVFVRDVVSANLFAATQEGMTGVYNVGYGGELTVLALARRIVEAAGSSSEIRHAPPRAGDLRRSCADVRRLLSAGFRPVSTLDAGLAETLAFFQNQ
jgi:UDP-glucose 4-epimerase